MSRIIVGRLPDSKKQLQHKHLSGIVGDGAQGSCKDKEERVPRQGVVGDLSGKVQFTVVANP